ncbi:hypothetical protein BpHYR1_041914 [Brachionus plicatilis]|uniref:Uncharacterized protein n=1 Tax=Brachionus plicatilis TaxID=10195 RepID=A0A3M7PFS1_BRAPC|nr:hypothetical protein BpHYR1_041914 [Brachionus plicatilis]
MEIGQTARSNNKKIFYLNNQHIIIKNTHRTDTAMYIPESLNQGSATDPLKFSDITYWKELILSKRINSMKISYYFKIKNHVSHIINCSQAY